ncbi:MAG TPA: C40 family peptidase [Chitinophagaceae bacterium]|nr:C40 family peptidase [Chitinophagaceae bacterium]
MLKKIIPALSTIIIMASCSSLKSVNYTNSKQADAFSSVSKNGPSTDNKEVKFLDDISVEPASTGTAKVAPGKTSGRQSANSGNNYLINRSGSVEKASEVQLKYAILLNTEVEQLHDNRLLEHVDEWYGTRYRYGGTTKSGIDCSAFVQAVYLSAFALSLPRTARDQYRNSRIISATEMKTGDLVFFNTTGGISHVGIYLQNNKFIHASTSQGVTVSDMFDPYYLKRFIGVGRIEKPEAKIK